MGWEIGLIGESLFAGGEQPESADLMPLSSAEKSESRKAEIADLAAQKEHKSEIPPVEETITITEQPLETKPCEDLKEEPEFEWGKHGTRFCWEITQCNNLQCPVRQRRIIRCFKYFEPRGETEKLAVTGGDVVCDRCHYKRGWDLGIIHEGLFEDILAERRRKNVQAERISREGIVDIYLQELSRKPLSKNEEMALARRIAGDSRASELFLLANLKLVVRIAGSFGNRGLNLLDLIQEGNLGLIKAISKFDYTLGYKFSTYAAYWVRYYMQKAISEQGRTIRIPHHLLIVSHKIQKVIAEQHVLLGRAPTLSELAVLLSLEEEKILSIIRLTEAPISIEAKSDVEGWDKSPEYYLIDKEGLSPEETALERSKEEACQNALATLPGRLREIVELFYGFRDEAVSLAEIGRRQNISRERARQLLRQALQELEKHEFVAHLKEYL
ncbi:MAG: RNA polymerase sigma factor RpoD/SigA [Candidatus Riflebacteria bacterium]|nr:RNA polymerase sigma factor RpoD/SigA [Candidatus Riflebacteria bacterium]